MKAGATRGAATGRQSDGLEREEAARPERAAVSTEAGGPVVAWVDVGVVLLYSRSQRLEPVAPVLLVELQDRARRTGITLGRAE